jgi:hypothetical protein
MSKLLINEPPLQFLPSLAAKVGDRQAICLQQLHFMLNIPGAAIERADDKGRMRRWIKATYAQWARDHFRNCWPADSIRKYFGELRISGYVLAAQFDIETGDATSYLSIDYDKLDDPHVAKIATSPSGKNRHIPPHVANSVEDHVAKIATSTIEKDITTTTTAAQGGEKLPAELEAARKERAERMADPSLDDPRVKDWREVTGNIPDAFQREFIMSRVKADDPDWRECLVYWCAEYPHAKHSLYKQADCYGKGNWKPRQAAPAAARPARKSAGAASGKPASKAPAPLDTDAEAAAQAEKINRIMAMRYGQGATA